MQGGGTPTKDRLDYWNGEIPWVSPKDMKSTVVSRTIDHITPEAVVGSATRIAPSGSILLVVRSGILKHTIPVALAGRDVALNQDMKALVATRALDARYFRYFIDGWQMLLLTEWRSLGATVESLDSSRICQTVVPEPPLATQRAIADFLDRKTAAFDALIEKKERLLTLLAEKRAALIHQAVTKGLDPNVLMKDSGIPWIGEIPAHWEVKRLKFLRRGPLSYGANEAADRNEPDDPRYIRITDLNADGTLRSHTFRSLPMCIARPYLLREGDILLARSGATVGKAVRYRNSWGECCYAGYLIKLSLDVTLARPDFIEWYTQSPCYWSQLEQSFIQATIQNVSAERYGEFVVPVPPIDEQAALVRWLSETALTSARVASMTVRSIAKLREYRQALITAAVTGQLDIEEAA